jgi:kumamolisin
LLGLQIARPKVPAGSVDHGRIIRPALPIDPMVKSCWIVEVAGAVAPAAQIAVYYASNMEAGFLDAVTSACHDATHKACVISMAARWSGTTVPTGETAASAA